MEDDGEVGFRMAKEMAVPSMVVHLADPEWVAELDAGAAG